MERNLNLFDLEKEENGGIKRIRLLHKDGLTKPLFQRICYTALGKLVQSGEYPNEESVPLIDIAHHLVTNLGFEFEDKNGSTIRLYSEDNTKDYEYRFTVSRRNSTITKSIFHKEKFTPKEFAYLYNRALVAIKDEPSNKGEHFHLEEPITGYMKENFGFYDLEPVVEIKVGGYPFTEIDSVNIRNDISLIDFDNPYWVYNSESKVTTNPLD